MTFTPGIYAVYTSHQVQDTTFEVVAVPTEDAVYFYNRSKSVVSTTTWSFNQAVEKSHGDFDKIYHKILMEEKASLNRPPVLFEIEERDYRSLGFEVPQYLLRRIARSTQKNDPEEFAEFSGDSKDLMGNSWDPRHTRIPKITINPTFDITAVSEVLTNLVTPNKNTPQLINALVDGAPVRKSKLKEKQKIDAVTAAIPSADASYLRPNGVRYYPRAWGVYQDIPVIRKAREAGQAIFLFGPPGTGKTAMVEAAFGEELITFLGSGDTEVADLVGSYVQNPDGTYSWVDGPLVIAAEQGRPILLDEVGLIDSKCLSVVYGLMDGRGELTVTANPERGTIKAAKGFYVMGATNPNAPGVHLSEALMSRFAIHTEVSTDWELATRLGVPDAMVRLGGKMNKQYATNSISWAPQLREALAFRDIYNTFGSEFAFANLLTLAPEGEEQEKLSSSISLITGVEVYSSII